MDEWSFFLCVHLLFFTALYLSQNSEGTGRVTIFASQGNARTFSYQPGDIGMWSFHGQRRILLTRDKYRLRSYRHG